eukprot:s5930_g4.t1
MATDEGKTLVQGARAVKTMYAVLEEISKRGVSHQLPPRFTTHAQGSPCPDAGIEMWINRVKVPVVIVASLAFVSQRNKADSTLHAISLLVRTFRECKVQEEKDMLAEQYVRSAARIVKALINDYRGNPDRHDQFPKLIEGISVKDLLHKATTTTLDRLGSQASKTHPPPNGIVDRLRLGDLFFQDVIKGMVVATTILHAWAKTFRVTSNTTPIVTDVRNCLLSVERAIDLPEDVWAFGGYQILRADNGVYDAIVARNKAFSLFSNVLSSMSGTQTAQGSTEIKHIPNWEVPLMPGDGREPIATEQVSSWDPDPIDMRPPHSIPQPEVKAMPKKPSPKPMPKGSSASSAGHASPKAKSRPHTFGCPTRLGDSSIAIPFQGGGLQG